ncbi:MAG: hypothetical protein ACXWCZ_11240 [Flavisolibacter sp.]
MKAAFLVLLTLISTQLFSQVGKTTTVEVYLFLPDNIKNGFAPTYKLTVYLQTFPDDPLKIKKKITAKKLRDNIYV